MKLPKGFRYAGIHSGIKPQRRDLAGVVCEHPCAAAGVFTVNSAAAAPVAHARAHLPTANLRAVVLNSGNANALTGQAGKDDVGAIAAAAAQALKTTPDAIVTASTGVIGVRLPAHKVIAAMPALFGALKNDVEDAAEAIMTTDTRMKLASRSVRIGGQTVAVAGFCKGAGMIAPQMATMLAVITTDASITPALLQEALARATDASFHNLVVDGDMSTNDAVFALASGDAGSPLISEKNADYERFSAVLTSLCEEMARDIAQDGEGATKLVEVRISGAPTLAIARDASKSIAASSLVKAAIFGADPNWGRVLATVGARAGANGWTLDPAAATVVIQNTTVYDRGPATFDPGALRARMREPEVKIDVDLHAGSSASTAWGCDLTYDYVKVNADYTSLIVTTPDGGTAKDDRLTNYSPGFKRSLLVEALNYIRRFSGQRCVIKYGGAAMVKETLKRSFCEDVNLLRALGLKPVVVHGGGPELQKALRRAGRAKGELVDGVRVTDVEQLKITEMVLSGSINSELVTLMNQHGGHAVVVSGKDGALLRARRMMAADGRDLGQVGDLVSVNRDFLEMLLSQGYVPVISPIGIGEDGQSYDMNTDEVAASIAAAIGAQKLIFLTNVAGVLERGEAVSELSSVALEKLLESGVIDGGMVLKARAILRALRNGVPSVHVVDGRSPHMLIAELFTDRGAGTLVTATGDSAP